jgi:hypothetical protein
VTAPVGQLATTRIFQSTCKLLPTQCPLLDRGAKRFPHRRWIPSRPGGGSTRSAVNEAGPTVLGRFPQKSLRAKQLFQNRRVQTGSPTEPHTLDCLTHSARLTSFENPLPKTICMGLPWSLFAVGAQRQGQSKLPPRLQRGWLPLQAETKTVNLRRDFRLKESRQRFLYPFRYHPSLGMSHRGCQPGWVTHPR